jgi:hypothetical protein
MDLVAFGGKRMEILVLIEPVPGNGFRATSGGPVAFTAEGSTREEALGNLREAIGRRVTHGAELAPLGLGTPLHPWARFAGTLRDDPLFDEWQEAIAEYRRRVDAEQETP